MRSHYTANLVSNHRAALEGGKEGKRIKRQKGEPDKEIKGKEETEAATFFFPLSICPSYYFCLLSFSLIFIWTLPATKVAVELMCHK